MIAAIPQRATNLRSLIDETAIEYSLDPVLVAAIIWQESRGDVYARRYENGFYMRYLALKKLDHFVPYLIPTQATERRDRAYSWGLMQIMGQTARENGFRGKSFIELLEPRVNLEIGCRFLSRLFNPLNAPKRSTEQALLKWNGGGNKNYPAEVLTHVSSGTYQRLFEPGG